MYRIRARLSVAIGQHPLVEKWKGEEERAIETRRRNNLVNRIHELDVLAEAHWIELNNIIKQTEKEEKLRLITSHRKNVI